MYELYICISLYVYVLKRVCICMLVGTGHRVSVDLSFLLLVESCRVQVRSDLGTVC